MALSLSDRIKRRQKEDEIAERMDRSILVSEWLPIVERLGRPGQVSGQEMVSKLAQLGIFVIAQLACEAKSESVKLGAGKELAYMGGFKPVDRSENLNVNIMAEAEVDALLRAKIHELGLDQTRQLECGAEAEIVATDCGEGESGETQPPPEIQTPLRRT